MSTETALRGRVICADTELADGVVAWHDGLLTYAGPAADWSGPTERVDTITPGLIDVHCHGGGGFSVEADPESAARHHLQHGTTGLLASLVSGPEEVLLSGLARIAEVTGPLILGAHLEGPWLDLGHCGAHDPAHLRDPDLAAAERLLAGGPVRMVTLAPERPGAAEVSGFLEQAGVIVGLGHTGADAADFAAALSTRERAHVTHLFNGMAPMHHRRPGPVSAALTAIAERSATVELIADGAHLADEIVELVFAISAESVILISDAMVAAGMADGAYLLGSLPVSVRDGVAWTQGGSLAGSTSHLSDVVRHCLNHTKLSPRQVIAAATAHPAALLGLTDRGDLRPGQRADLAVFDADWQVARVLHGGTWVR